MCSMSYIEAQLLYKDSFKASSSGEQSSNNDFLYDNV